ncbi:putative Zn-binding protein involved in type VI secretion [Paraburkholderia bannensis]|uniref:Putative Zn-binding protein involved in type VI secretion n=1 Tax=Paraburkholderia bannensis TaxID=765414 RepID=A0A7W9TYD9_9BURK|nr:MULTISPECIES: PAAR domain-containing protein [Paraburkholderia]MBB3257462.1 putative Zn-binding protein involved in type VI secretion [Paraburkholderia sp. WP4_3_2]MBB6102475.1 putative Zn-binding protein involved in type VI secretion [Paraburkholderia bannensis]
MAGKKYIVVGDTHSHGGRVVAGAPNSRIAGKAIARIGDAAVCAIHGPTVIVEGSGNAKYDGRAAATDGDLLACGGRLIASQTTTGG